MEKADRNNFLVTNLGENHSGNTCFVNAVLQAVAACPSLLLWLEENGNQFPQAKEKHNLQTSLLTVLRVINGFDIDVIESSDGESEVGDPEVWAPARLFRALSAHGWVANYQVSSLTQFIFLFNFNIKVGVSICLHFKSCTLVVGFGTVF